jgi:hypothetical protein
VRKRPLLAHEASEDFDVVDASGEWSSFSGTGGAGSDVSKRSASQQSIVVFDTRMKADMRGMTLTPHLFMYDRVFDEHASNAEVFVTSTHHLVEHGLQGQLARVRVRADGNR